MLPADHDLADLQARAALATGWPTLHLAAPDAQAALDRIEALVGPCPQAELLESWTGEDPPALRIALPGLTPAQWAGLERDLAPWRPVLAPTPSPGALEAQDQLALIPDVLPADPLPATLWADAEGGGLRTLDLAEEEPDPAGAALASELVAAVQAVSPELAPDVGDAIAFVRHRSSGRRGLRVHIAAEHVQSLSGDALTALRTDLVAAVGRVIVRRAPSEHALAPDIGWDPRFGLSLLVWRITEPGEALPADAALTPGLHPPLRALRSLRLHGRVTALEVQVLPAPRSDHDAVSLALAEHAEGLPVRGGPSRWLRDPDPVLCPTWRVEPGDLDDCLDWIAALPDRDDVAAVRVVPVDPRGLEERDPFLEPAWTWLGDRFVVRWRDGAQDRDARVLTRERPVHDSDRAALNALRAALARVPGLDAERCAPQPVRDAGGRHGLVIALQADLSGWALGWALGAVASVPCPELGSVVDLILPAHGPEIALWFAPPEDIAPLWGCTG